MIKVVFPLTDFGTTYNGVVVDRPHCIACKHLSDVYWDFTHGPYMLMCSIKGGCEGYYCCSNFELDERLPTIDDFLKDNSYFSENNLFHLYESEEEEK